MAVAEREAAPGQIGAERDATGSPGLDRPRVVVEVATVNDPGATARLQRHLRIDSQTAGCGTQSQDGAVLLRGAAPVQLHPTHTTALRPQRRRWVGDRRRTKRPGSHPFESAA